MGCKVEGKSRMTCLAFGREDTLVVMLVLDLSRWDNLSLSYIWRWDFFFFFPWLCRAACGISVPRLGIEPGPRQGNHQILTTGPPGNSLRDGINAKRSYLLPHDHRNRIEVTSFLLFLPVFGLISSQNQLPQPLPLFSYPNWGSSGTSRQQPPQPFHFSQALLLPASWMRPVSFCVWVFARRAPSIWDSLYSQSGSHFLHHLTPNSGSLPRDKFPHSTLNITFF